MISKYIVKRRSKFIYFADPKKNKKSSFILVAYIYIYISLAATI